MTITHAAGPGRARTAALPLRRVAGRAGTARLTALLLVVVAVLGGPGADARATEPAVTATVSAAVDLAAGDLARRAATRAVGAATGGAPLAALPADFPAVMGYTPEVVRLAGGAVRAIEPTGACSSTIAGTPFGFTAVCAAHDYGYDLLRYAAARGEPLGPGARRRIDRLLGQDLHAHCDATTHGLRAAACHALATVYDRGARFNTWRQAGGTP